MLATPGQVNEVRVGAGAEHLRIAVFEVALALAELGDEPHAEAIARAERLVFSTDCGLSQPARWAARQKLASLVAGVAIVNAEL